MTIEKQIAETEAALAKAQSDLDRALQAWDNYSGNNPNKYRGAINRGRELVKIYTDVLARLRAKQAGGDQPPAT